MMEREHYRYHPRYCEENIWHLCQQPEFHNSDVVIIASEGEYFPIRCQRAASSPDEVVLWDYHVVLLWCAGSVSRYVLDFDTTLSFCSPVEDYFRQSFLDEDYLKPAFVPLFRVMPASDYVTQLLSDRSHMRTAAGWMAEPPDWPPISMMESNLEKFIDMTDREFGQVMTAEQLLR